MYQCSIYSPRLLLRSAFVSYACMLLGPQSAAKTAHKLTASEDRLANEIILFALVCVAITAASLYSSMKQKPEVTSPFLEDAQLSELVSPGPHGFTLNDLLRQWPENKPKGFIYVLVEPAGIDWAISVAQNVFANFNKRHHYPFVVFSESADVAKLLRSAIKAKGESASLLGQMFSYDISRFWRIPDFLLERHNRSLEEFIEFSVQSIKQSGCGLPKDLNYWLMCRFQSKGVLEIPFVRYFEYAWRLDRDSSLCGEISFDIFSHMKAHDYWQGFAAIDPEDTCAQKLTEHVQSYVKEYAVIPAQGNDSIADARTQYIYNNFEIFKIQFYLGKQYQHFVNYTEQSGGFFYYRWGDAPVRTQASRLFMPALKMKHFKPGEVYYQHQHFYSCPNVAHNS